MAKRIKVLQGFFKKSWGVGRSDKKYSRGEPVCSPEDYHNPKECSRGRCPHRPVQDFLCVMVDVGISPTPPPQTKNNPQTNAENPTPKSPTMQSKTANHCRGMVFHARRISRNHKTPAHNRSRQAVTLQ